MISNQTADSTTYSISILTNHNLENENGQKHFHFHGTFFLQNGRFAIVAVLDLLDLMTNVLGQKYSKYHVFYSPDTQIKIYCAIKRKCTIVQSSK